jgi:hypothetical protein
MLRYPAVLLACLILFSASAHAKTLTYTIDHGTVGVITSGSGKARLVIQASGDCKVTPYSVVTDGVLAISGNFNLTRALSMPLDYTEVTLSCSDKEVTAVVNQTGKSDSLF